ncbi:MAG: heat-inducible transcriptional repressor HrcA [Acholeplasmatales bacterium]|jgi:heat-inducible transcriptional repressor|nr:heat-inducible transcriptional repressor HrcA [Acholeplasmatales bacterium]
MYSSDLTNRQKLILKAIIEEYIRTSNPVGSKTLTEVPYLNYSSATIRYDMQELEENGFLDKTHTSSGRIPSLKGYEYYMRYTLSRDSEVAKVFSLIDEVIQRNQWTAELAVEECSNLLANLTNYAVVSIPKGQEMTITKIDLVQTGFDQGVGLIVTNNGKVFYHNFSTKNISNLIEISKVAKLLNDVLVGHTLEESLTILKSKYEHNDVSLFKDYQNQIVESFIWAFTRFINERVYVIGLMNLFNQTELRNPEIVKELYSKFERTNVAKLINEGLGHSINLGGGIYVINDGPITIVCVPYIINDNENGIIGLVGPNRMDYQRVIPLLEYLSSKLTNFYNKGE